MSKKNRATAIMDSYTICNGILSRAWDRMSKTEKFAFSERHISVIQEMNHRLWQRYPQVTDSADRDNVIGLTLRRVADHEEKLGEAQNLPALIRFIFPQVVANVLRRSYYKIRYVPAAASEAVLPETAYDPRMEIENRIYADELLSTLDDRSREIVYRRLIRGQEPAEIASLLRISVGNVRVILHRAIEKLRQVR